MESKYGELQGNALKQRLSQIKWRSKGNKLCWLLVLVSVVVTALAGFITYYSLNKYNALDSKWNIVLLVLAALSLIVAVYIAMELRSESLTEVLLCSNRKIAIDNKDFNISFHCDKPHHLEKISNDNKEMTRRIFYRNVKAVIHDKDAMMYAVDCDEYDLIANGSYTRYKKHILIPDTFESNEFWSTIASKSKIKITEETLPISLENSFIKLHFILYSIVMLIIIGACIITVSSYSRKYNDELQATEQLVSLRQLDYYTDSLANATSVELKAVDAINSNSNLGMTFMGPSEEEIVYAEDGSVLGIAEHYPDDNSPMVISSLIITPNASTNLFGMHDGVQIKECKEIMSKYGFDYFNNDDSINDGCTVFYVGRVSVFARYSKSDNVITSFRIMYS